MAKITFVMDDNVENKLRRMIEYRKGALGQALSEGAQLWIDKNSNKISHNLKNSKKTGNRKRVKK